MRMGKYQAQKYLIIVLLLVAFAQMSVTIRGTSMTVDEGLHITSGYSILKTGDFRLIEEHPPLLKIWMSLPLLFVRNLPDVTAVPAWHETDFPLTESLPLLRATQQWLYAYAPLERVIFSARAMIALLGILLLATLSRWADTVSGMRCALLALSFASFDPGIIAHSAVATTDIGSAALILLTLLAAYRFMVCPKVSRALMMGLSLGLALCSKLTSVLLLPVLAVSGVGILAGAPRQRRRRVFCLEILALVVAALIVWAAYGFDIGPVPGLPLPLPAPAHAIPVMRLLSHSQSGHQSYLMGEHSSFGWRHYFPIAFVLKTPLSALIGGLWALICVGREVLARHSDRTPKSTNSNLRRSWLLIVFAGTYWLVSLFSSLNIGYRHLLPTVPMLYLLIGSHARPKLRENGLSARAAPVFIGLLITWQALGTLFQLPCSLAYFNELTGGSTNGWRYLADSNTDWGQGYKALAAYQEDHATGPVRLAAFIFYDPTLYGVDYEALPPMRGDTPAVFPSRFAPPPGNYVISATPLDGIPLSDPEMYDWFRWRQPDAQIANALHYYEVTAAETVTAWVAQCSTPTPPLTAAALAEGFGRGGDQSVDRVLAFDCTRAWVYPASVSRPGAYVLHGSLLDDSLAARLHLEAPVPTLPTAARHLGGAHITYRQRAYREAPAFAIYRMQEAPALPDGASRPAPAESMLSDVQHQPEQEAPVALEGPLAFIGARAYSYDEGLEVESWWQVVASPTPRPFSIMGHLLAADGTVLGVDDGLGLDPASLQEGDILVEVHRYETQAQVDELWFRTGAYWLDSLERWSVGDGNADAIFVRISSLR